MKLKSTIQTMICLGLHKSLLKPHEVHSGSADGDGVSR